MKLRPKAFWGTKGGNKLVVPAGIEPASSAPETDVLSIKLWDLQKGNRKDSLPEVKQRGKLLCPASLLGDKRERLC